MDTLTFTKAGRRPVKNVAINQDSLTRVTLRWPAGTENSPLGYCQSRREQLPVFNSRLRITSVLKTQLFKGHLDFFF